jgi:hypothetical protein
VEARDVAEVGDEVKGFSVQENFLLKKKKRGCTSFGCFPLNRVGLLCPFKCDMVKKKKKR